MPKIKICGLKREEDVEYVNRCRPDYAGFVFAGEKRRITPEFAACLKRKLAPEILSVGVFVNAEPDLVLGLCADGIIDLIQLHGEEDLEYIEKLREKTDKKIIRAVRVQSEETILAAAELPVDYLLFDTYRKGVYGGSGAAFDWNMISRAQEKLELAGRRMPDYFLAGGLDAGNLGEALRQLNPYAADISSGVETNGVKDENKIRQVIAELRRFDRIAQL